MEFSKRDRLISLIMPFVSVLYGVFVLISHIYHPMFQLMTGFTAIGGGIVTGLVMMLRGINIVPCLKSPTIAAVITFWLHMVASTDIITADFIDVFYKIFFICIDLGSVIFMIFRLPVEAERRQKLAVFFANPVLYSLLNSLMKSFSDFLSELHLLH